MTQSILQSTKKVLGIPEEMTQFDVDIIMHINGVFSTLRQLGVGPALSFTISDGGADWEDFLEGKPHLEFVKSYMYMRVRLLFDPPQTGHHMEAYKTQITELEWRLKEAAEEYPNPVVPVPGELVIDGGAP